MAQLLDRQINALLEPLENVANGHRTQEAVARLLVKCQRCRYWAEGCTVEGRTEAEWVRLLITDGCMCSEHRPRRGADTP